MKLDVNKLYSGFVISQAAYIDEIQSEAYVLSLIHIQMCIRDRLLEAARKTEKLVVFVTNEVGGGIVPDNVMAREYRDLAGWINQQVADVCDRVFYCVAGQAVDLKKMAFSFDDEGAEQWKK